MHHPFSEDTSAPGEPLRPAGTVALVLGGAFAAMAIVAVAVLLPGMAHDFAGVPHVALLVQLVGALAPTALALGAPFAGRLVDRVGYRAVYLGGLLAFAVTGALPFVLDNLYLILLSRAALGLSAAAVLIAALSGIGAQAEARRARLLGFQTFAGGAAAMLLYPGVAVIARHGWRPGFLVHLLVLALIPLVLTLPKGIGGPRHVQAPRGTGPLLSPGLIAVAGLCGMIMFIGGMFAPLFLPSIGVTRPALWAIPPTIGAGLGLAVSASYGWLHTRMSTNVLFTVAMGFIGGGLAISGLASSLWLFTLGSALTGAALALFSPALSAAAIARAGPGQAGRAVGLANGALYCSQIVFPFISTPLAQVAGLRGVYLVFGGAALLFAAKYLWASIRRSGPPALGQPSARLEPMASEPPLPAPATAAGPWP